MQTQDGASLPERIQAAQLKKWPVVLLSAFGATLGAFPFLLYLGLVQYLPLAAVFAAVAATLSVRKVHCSVTEEPVWGEWLLAGWSTVFLGSLISLEGFAFYAFFYWGYRGLMKLSAYLGFSLQIDGPRLATIASLLIAAIVALLQGSFAGELLRKLYPEVTGTRSPFFPLAAKPRYIVMAALGLVIAVAAGLRLLEPTGLAFTFLLTMALFYTSAPLAQTGGRRGEDKSREISSMIEKLLAAAGYHTTRSPVTGNAAIDPLISDVDYLALSGERAYAVELKVAPDADQSVDWSAASALRTAAKALQDALPSRGDVPIRVNPLLIVVGGRIDDALRLFSEEQGVKLVHFGREIVRDSLPADGQSQRERALQLLGIPPGNGASAPATSSSG
jgi:hypothetical protein